MIKEIVILVGVPGSGKSTIAKMVADTLGVKYHSEVFENNPYILGDNPSELITLWQIAEHNKASKSADSGVFDTCVCNNISVYLSKEQRNRLKFLSGKTVSSLLAEDFTYHKIFFLEASASTLKNRITKRARPSGFLEKELELCDSRLQNTRENKNIINRCCYTIDAEQSPTQIVNQVLKNLV